ncbi:hypothetical protein M011DRAFT_476467 [Sporormia fimetaria CBS 119925]|uniref:F-box domain-containing protein n=1 Tax=Sporormia fimetaria CBS 119925 TaxID=1340428 RepID=A0A6A6VF77_9PLEO|nr:hypothetical protein M011DRAFT_476467 [Sporormia fimetaria CBS 119925]
MDTDRSFFRVVLTDTNHAMPPASPPSTAAQPGAETPSKDPPHFPTEILEEIFDNLPPLEPLCKVQLVCVRWKEIVNTSWKLRVKLFLPPPELCTQTKFLLSDRHVNPWVSRIFGSSLKIFKHLTFAPYIEDDGGLEGYPIIFAHAIGSSPALISTNASLHHPNASWRRMHITVPPALDLCVYDDIHKQQDVSAGDNDYDDALVHDSYFQKRAHPPGVVRPASYPLPPIKTGFLMGDFCATRIDHSMIVKIDGVGGTSVLPAANGVWALSKRQKEVFGVNPMSQSGPGSNVGLDSQRCFGWLNWSLRDVPGQVH